MLVAVDFGHGLYVDSGAVSEIMSEETVVNAVGRALCDEITLRGHRLLMVRPLAADSERDSLNQRCDESNKAGADLYVSLHANAFMGNGETTNKPMGVEVFAISDKAKAVAARVESAISGQGFKSRGVKDGDKLFVLKYTQAPAILIELFFIDSIADCELYKNIGAVGMATAIGEALLPMDRQLMAKQYAAEPDATINSSPISIGEVAELLSADTSALAKDGDSIVNQNFTVSTILSRCDTGLARGLSLQLIAKLNRMTKTPLLVELKHPLIDTSSAAVNPYLQSAAAAALIRAVEQRGKRLVINSCLRTTVQQHLIKCQCTSKLCGITAAASPGKSNHESGLAIDIEDPHGWRSYLEDAGWAKLGDWDDMHYDYWDGRTDIAGLQISAFQQLWNQYNPGNGIAVDGGYGSVTAERIDRSPIDGW